MERYLTIVEVSQKQAYIFSSNKLKDNIERSGEIAWITGTEFIKETINADNVGLFSEDKNLVYSGGGHTILEFESRENAVKAVKSLTRRILKEIPEIELFAKTIEYDESKTPGDNVKNLTAALEKKKAERKSSFHQGTFGLELFDQNTGKAIRTDRAPVQFSLKEELVPEGFRSINKFEDLGGTENVTNFIAVVHIDGNAMGKRVEEISSSFSNGDWDQYKKQMRLFSESVAKDFRQAYKDMENEVAACISDHHLEELNLPKKKGLYPLPVRRIIAEGDDICFVAEGRIGVECAVSFIKALNKKVNAADNKSYAACAGVALVHQKYPFYRAYELAEQLCSHAKKIGATLSTDGTGSEVSSIDWHVEFGELQDSLEETRKQYLVREVDHEDDPATLELRPYIITAPADILEKEPLRNYLHFSKLMKLARNKENAYGKGTMKELRKVLKQGETATQHYLTYHKIEELARDYYQGIYTEIIYDRVQVGSGEELERKLFARTADGKKRSLIFDAIEMMDTYLPVQ